MTPSNSSHSLNSLNPHIQFKAEVTNNQGAIPFLDTLVSLGPNGTLITSVYRKPTHTEQCLHWHSHYSIATKYTVFNTLTHRVHTICLDQVLFGQGQQHIRTTLNRCDYPFRSFTVCKQNVTFSLVSRTVTLTPIHAGTRTTRLTTSIW